MRPERDSYAWKAARGVRLVVGVHRCGRGARGYCRHLEQCCIKVRLLAAQLHHNWRTTRPQSATRCASTCETVPQVCAEPAVTIAHQSVKSTCPSRKVCASHFVKPERRRRVVRGRRAAAPARQQPRGPRRCRRASVWSPPRPDGRERRSAMVWRERKVNSRSTVHVYSPEARGRELWHDLSCTIRRGFGCGCRIWRTRKE